MHSAIRVAPFFAITVALLMRMSITCLNEMRYIEINTGPWSGKPLPWWCRLLQKIIPPANPDLEQQFYPLTRRWWVELDDKGVPQREIGFDADGKPIVLGPVGHNFGFTVDTTEPWPESDEDSAEATKEFQKTWETLWPQFKHLEA